MHNETRCHTAACDDGLRAGQLADLLGQRQRAAPQLTDGNHAGECEEPSVEGLQHHITANYAKEIDKLKTQKSKDARAEILKDKLKHVETHKDQFNDLFKLHRHLQIAKDALVHTLSKHTGGLEHHIEGTKVKPEGFVVNHEGKLSKLNDRNEFNRLNRLARR